MAWTLVAHGRHFFRRAVGGYCPSHYLPLLEGMPKSGLPMCGPADSRSIDAIDRLHLV